MQGTQPLISAMAPRTDLGAVVLATAISSVAPAPMILEVELRVKPVRRVIESVEPPLDLDANVFRYRVENGRVVPVHDEPENTNGTGAADAIGLESHHHARASAAQRGSGSRRWSSGASRPLRRR